MKELDRIIENAFEAGFREAAQGPQSRSDPAEPLSGTHRAADPKRFEKPAR